MDKTLDKYVPQGLKITFYRIATQFVPGLLSIIALLLVCAPTLLSDLLGEEVTGSVAIQGTRISSLAVWTVIVLTSFPLGLLLSGLSFFVIGWPCMTLRSVFAQTPLSWVIAAAIGRPRTIETSSPFSPSNWARYIQRLQFIQGSHRFRGPRSDDPEMVLGVAIFSRTLSFMFFILYLIARFSSTPNYTDLEKELAFLSIVTTWILIVFTALAETYRDFTICIAVESLAEYEVLNDVDYTGVAKALEHARKNLRNEPSW